MKTNTPTNGATSGRLALKHFRPAIAKLVLMSAMALLASASALVLAASRANPNPRVIPPASDPYGKSYGEWAGMYWQWLISFPANQSPAFEQGDVVYGAQKQSGPVWILESGNIGVWYRNVRVPAGKGLLFSLGGGEEDTSDPNLPGTTEQDLRDFIEAFVPEAAIAVSGDVDGVPLEQPELYVVRSPLFDVRYPVHGLGDPPPGTYRAIAKGWFFVLAPLSRGQHTIHVHVEYPEFGVAGDTTYHLAVE